MSAEIAANPLPRRGVWGDQSAPPPPSVDWLWKGYLARGALTLLTSQWKTGKTTLLSVLLARMGQGGELAGLPLARGKAAIVSEERLECWQERGFRLGFGREVCYFCRPFSARPTLEAWHALVDELAQVGVEHGVALTVIDPLAYFLPGAVENQSAALLQVLQPLERLTWQRQAVLLLHHPRKHALAAGMLARGSGALCTLADVIVEMDVVPHGPEGDRRRRLTAWSRFADTPRSRVIELSADGRDYSLVDPAALVDAFQLHWHSVERILAYPPRKLTRQEILSQWPARGPAPSPSVLWRVLDRAVEEELLEQEGSGTRGDPYYYWLANLPADWEPEEDDRKQCWDMVEHLLTCPLRALTRYQFLRNWPKHVKPPHPVLLWRTLERAVEESKLERKGNGTRLDPHRYQIAGTDSEFQLCPEEVLDW
jgi:hypothetical protein